MLGSQTKVCIDNFFGDDRLWASVVIAAAKLVVGGLSLDSACELINGLGGDCCCLSACGGLGGLVVRTSMICGGVVLPKSCLSSLATVVNLWGGMTSGSREFKYTVKLQY